MPCGNTFFFVPLCLSGETFFVFFYFFTVPLWQNIFVSFYFLLCLCGKTFLSFIFSSCLCVLVAKHFLFFLFFYSAFVSEPVLSLPKYGNIFLRACPSCVRPGFTRYMPACQKHSTRGCRQGSLLQSLTQEFTL